MTRAPAKPMTASAKMQHDETAESPFYIPATAIPAYRPRTLKDGDTFLLVDHWLLPWLQPATAFVLRPAA